MNKIIFVLIVLLFSGCISTTFQHTKKDKLISEPIYIQSKPIQNETGSKELPTNLSKMLQTAVTKINRPIVYVPYDPDFIINQKKLGGKITVIFPKVVITGAITEYDRGVEIKESTKLVGLRRV